MTSIRLDVDVAVLEPAGDLIYLEGRATDGSQVGLYLLPRALPMKASGEPQLAVGQRVGLVLELPEPVQPSLRERMQRGAPSGAPPASPGMTMTRSSASPPGGTTATRPGATTPATPRAMDPTAVIMSSILGRSPRAADIRERDVDDEMDALIGRK